MGSLKSIALRALTASGVTALLRPLHRNVAVILMLHRFTDPARGVVGDDPAHVRKLLAYLRRKRYQLVGLDTLLESLAGDSRPLHHAIALTIDDGYSEQATVAGPLFAEFDCPVTTFVTTGFLDGSLWFWWDQIEFVLKHAAGPTLTFEGPGGHLTYRLDDAGRRTAQTAITAQCKTMTDDDKHELIGRLAAAAAVPLPALPPPEYAPMTWEQLRACEGRGMTFGPHTVTHPILARLDDRRAELEIRASWARLKSEATAPVAIFAYPNGEAGDWSEREYRVLRQEGLRGVTAIPGFVTAPRYRTADGPLSVPRFACPDSYEHFVQLVGGLERVKTALRALRA